MAMVPLGNSLGCRSRIHTLVFLPPRNLRRQHPPLSCPSPPKVDLKCQPSVQLRNQTSSPDSQPNPCRCHYQTLRDHDQRSSCPVHKCVYCIDIWYLLQFLRGLRFGLRTDLWIQPGLDWRGIPDCPRWSSYFWYSFLLSSVFCGHSTAESQGSWQAGRSSYALSNHGFWTSNWLVPFW